LNNHHKANRKTGWPPPPGKSETEGADKMHPITKETRRESFYQILESLGQRQYDVMLELYETPGVTANELALKMYKKGYFPRPERNFVHPRLTELMQAGLIRVAGKRKCSVTGRNCAIYVPVELDDDTQFEQGELTFE